MTSRWAKHLCQAVAHVTVFSAMKDPSTFFNREDFDIMSTSTVIDNYATSTIFNHKSLFVGKLTPTRYFRLITVGGNGHMSTHHGAAEVSIKTDHDSVVKIAIPNTLYYPTSPLNEISIGKLSWHYGEGNYDEDTCIKSIDNRS